MCENYLIFKSWIIFHCVYTVLCLSIHLSKNTSVPIFQLLWIMLLWIWVTNICSSLCFLIFGCISWISIEHHMWILCLSFWGATIPFSSVAAPFYFIPLYDRILQLMALSYFAYLFTYWHTFKSFLHWAIVASAAMNISVQVLFECLFSIYIYIYRSGVAEPHLLLFSL